MDTLLPQAYLIGLVAILLVAAVVVGRQIWRVRRDEATLARLDAKGDRSDDDAATLYELASVQLRKRLYGQAVDNLKRALRKAESGQEPGEALALIQNALGFGLAAQNNYKAAIRHYRAALAAKPDYPVALNNLAYALEKQSCFEEAQTIYRQALELEPSNKTAKKRLQRLERTDLTKVKASAP
ncbi:MAG: tetratricopeptide repeat protein [Cyanobacteria bacterium M_surface_10_m2_119]|nr:tetratricopeptide repeat protein [Cyanobacteria bacterium M_surface_10_m2_119]